MSSILDQIKKFPDTSGVYIFCDRNKKILYIGKATSLKDRVRSYFNSDLIQTRGPLIAKMIEEAKSVDFEKTDSVLEALILEANLIKKYQPIYNTKEKDNKSFNFIVVTKEDFPRILIVRGREMELGRLTSKYVFGPFPQGSLLKEALKIVRKIFPFRDRCSIGSKKPAYAGRSCFNRQIGLCPGVCSGEISKKEYATIIANIKLFFEGKKKTLIKKLEKQMFQSAKEENFEKAGEIKRKIFALKHIQDISLIKDEYKQINFNKNSFRIEGYDVAHISGTNTVGAMVVIEDGKAIRSEYRKFKIEKDTNNDTACLREILNRRFGHSEWALPKMIVVDGGKAQINVALSVLKEFGYRIPIVGVVKGEHHKPKNILGDKDIIKKYEKDILLADIEAHRFAISYFRRLVAKSVTKSVVKNITYS